MATILCPLFLAFFVPLLATVLLPEAMGSPYSKALWVTCTVDEATLAGDATLQKETLAGISRGRCVSLAALRGWPFLACWTKDRQCTLWGLQALANAVPGHNLQADCLMPKDFDGCKADDGSMKLGTQTEFEFKCTDGYTYGCVNGKYQIKGVHPLQPLTRCSSPFSSTPHGCIQINAQPLSWSASRLACLSFGADLYVPSSGEKFVSFTNYLEANYASSTDNVWMGVHMLPNITWQWLGGRPLVENLEAKPGNVKISVDQPYARSHKFSATDRTLGDCSCGEKFTSICQLKIY